ncbi:probable G-protein coupled receptor 139 [Mobula hypostoma]|uniref:probable G-protein coupled receptor 139 n=1 Tax=Mobula hypostoma TaxID=723540 RepID=UPI002FC31A3E
MKPVFHEYCKSFIRYIRRKTLSTRTTPLSPLQSVGPLELKMGYPAIYYTASIYYPVLAAIGIPVNLVAIVILSLGNCGLSKCISRYLVGMAAADLLGVIIAVVLSEINNIYVYARSLLITPICAVTLVLRLATMDYSVWLTVAFTFDRCIAICSQTLRERYCSERTATIVILIVGLGCCAKYVPFYFAVEPYCIIDNIPWRCIFGMDYFTLPAWKAYQLFNTITAPLLPIGLILLFNALTVSHIIAANRVRRGLRNSREKKNDPEAENRRKSIMLLFALSANFILLWIPYIVYTMNWQVQNYSYADRYLNTSKYILQQSGIMLQYLCTCTNTCIYTLSQRKFREELKGEVKRLVTLYGRLCS